MRCICVEAISLIVLLLGTATTQAQQTINVPADQPTIQAAINAANTGDTVQVAPGTYAENINFGGKVITVTSSGGPSVTTIDGGALGSVVTFSTRETANSVLNGFTIRNGLQNGLSGGGIYISSASPTITGNVITGNHAAVGCGIYVSGGSPLIQNNTITGNDQTGAGDGGQGGGGILVSGSDSAPAAPQIIGNTIANNSVAYGGNGGGISVGYFSSPLIQGNLIQGNSAYNFGGGVALQSYNSPVLVQNLIVNNTSSGGGSGGGLYISPNSNVTQVTSNTIAANSAYDNTSGIYVTGFGQNATFTNNIVVAAAGQSAITCNSLYSSLSPVFSHNDAFTAQGTAWAGICDTTSNPGDISAEPLFMSAANGDFHLQAGSPAIDAGDSSASNLPNTDLDGNPRVAGTIDLGAYEVVTTSAANISPNNLSFAPQLMGSSSARQDAALTSTGNAGFQITSVQITTDFTVTTTCPTLKDPGGFSGLSSGTSCIYNVSFTPSATGSPAGGPAPGPRMGSLTVNGTNGASLVVSLNGTALSPNPTASVSGSYLQYPLQAVGTSSAPQPLTLTTLGGPALSIASITASQQFSETDNCPPSLAGGASCTINVSFAPTVTGAINGTVTIADNAADSPQSVTLSGTGGAATAKTSLSFLDFGNQALNAKSAPYIVLLSNTGNVPLTVNSITTSGDFAQTNDCGSSVGASAYCTIKVTFTPTVLGTRSGGLTLSDNSSSGSPQSVPLSGTGLRPATASFSPPSLNFGGQLIGTTSAPQILTVTNTGDIGLSMGGNFLVHAPFTLVNPPGCSTGLAPGASCQVYLAFQPTVPGPVNGVLQVFDSASDSPQTINLSGTGLKPAAVSFNVPGIGFAPQIVGTTSIPTQVLLSNAGDVGLNISNISVSASFGQTNSCPATLAGGTNCAIYVTFTPQVSGQVNGSLSVTDSSAGSPHTLSSNGTGVDFTIFNNQSAISVFSGASANATVYVNAAGGVFNQSVSLSCSALPAGVTCSFSPGAVTPGNGGVTSSLLIQTTKRRGNSGTSPGTYTININGTSGNLVHSTTITLYVH